MEYEVKLLVELDPAAQIVLGFELDRNRLGVIDLSVRDVSHRQFGRRPIESMSDYDNVVHLFPVQLTDDPTSMGIVSDQALGNQISDRLPDRGGAELELLGDLGLDDPRSADEIAAQDRTSDRFSCVLVSSPTTQLTDATGKGTAGHTEPPARRTGSIHGRCFRFEGEVMVTI